MGVAPCVLVYNLLKLVTTKGAERPQKGFVATYNKVANCIITEITSGLKDCLLAEIVPGIFYLLWQLPMG